MTTDITTTDDELDALMADLEAQNDLITAQQAKVTATQPSAAQLAALESEPEPTPEPVAEPTPEPVAEEAPPWQEPEKLEEISTEEELAALEASIEAEPVAVAPPEEAKKPVEVVSPKPPAPATIDPDDAPDVGHDGPPGMMPGLQHYVNVTTFRSETRVTEATLDACMIEQNGLRAYYGSLAAHAEAQAARLKMKFDVIEATIYNEHRKALAATGEKSTEKMVENAVKMDRRWLRAKNMVIEAETIATINKNLVESLKDRRDMIIQLGADRRDEYKGAARVLAQQNDHQSTAERALAAAKGAMAKRAA